METYIAVVLTVTFLQADPSLDALYKLSERLTLVLLLLLILYTGAKEVWVWGWQHRALRKDHDYWRDLAVRGTDVAQKAVTVAEKGKVP